MVTYDDISVVARTLKRRLGTHAFMAIPRKEVTSMLREASGQDRTRIKVRAAADLEAALHDIGIRCFPSLVGTTTGDTIRLFHTDSVLGSLLDLLLHPSTENDPRLGTLLAKIKGNWDWSRP